MKKGLYILLILCAGCNSENAWDCIQAAGDSVSQEYPVADFTKIRIEDEVSLVVREGATRRVVIETGANLLNEVSVSVEGETLVIRDANNCNLVREYGATIATVTTPELTEIRNSSSFDVTGEGVLNFPDLKLVSDTTGNVEDSRKSGDFRMTVNCDRFSVSANGQSVFYIDGSARLASLTFEDEFPRFEGKNLIVQTLILFQRSANQMIVNPQEEIRGSILGTGDVISHYRPPVIDVEEFFTGRLIFPD